LFSDDSIEHYENVVVLLLNRANKVLGWMQVGSGGLNSCVIDVRIVMQAAINANASGIILAHNHPSGNLKASQEDLNITKKVKEAAKLFDINLLDHLIVTTDGYYSLSDAGLM
jgi:DNA repair protein RadC